MEILFARHGQTEWNLLRKVQGKADIELNEKGIEQARKTRDSLKNEEIDLILINLVKHQLLNSKNFDHQKLIYKVLVFHQHLRL